jgi:competence protein ComEA
MLPEENNQNSSSNFEEILYRNRFIVFFLLLGATLVLLGIGISRNKNLSSDKIQTLENNSSEIKTSSEIVVEIAGKVENPGVYKLPTDSRIEDLLIIAGGISENADRDWMEKYLNRAARLNDGQKIYIPTLGEQTNAGSANNYGGYQTTSSVLGGENSGLVNINSASLTELDSLPGIGPVYGQNIIDHRPYSNSEELKTKGVLGASLYEKIKNLITIN